MLIVDCCIRGEASATRRYYQAWLRAHPPEGAQVLELDRLGLRPLDRAELEARDALSAAGRFDHPMFDLARQFRDAEEILIAAPYWDLAFPALLKVYLERVSVSGLTFGYTPDGRCVGHCGARRLLYFSTCGGPKGDNLGFAYVKALAGMLGIGTCVPYVLEGLDMDPARREAILAEAVARLERGE